VIAILGIEELSEEDRLIVSRARRAQRFLTQPFFSTERFTNLPGRYVSLEETLRGLEQRVADRTRALATSTEVGRRLSTILDQQELVREVQGYDSEAWEASDTVRYHIYRIRQKLRAASEHADILQTIRGVGYMFVAGGES